MGTPLHARRVVALRLSLFAVLGLPAVACGGATRSAGGDDGGGSAGSRGTTRAGSGTGQVTGSGGAVGTGGGVATGTAGAPIEGGAGPVVPTPCMALGEGASPGVVACAEGYLERIKAGQCYVSSDAGSGGAGGESGSLERADGTLTCGDDESVCEQFELGYCDTNAYGMDQVIPVCRSGCRADQDCGSEQVCLCTGDASTGGRCFAATCRQTSDCEPGYRCASYARVCSPMAFACQSAQDECLGTSDCDGVCSLHPGIEHRTCQLVDCGRPFLVHAQPRLATAVPSEAWSRGSSRQPELASLDVEERERLAAHWTRLGQMEHASIAAFARFSLQLLALGAPPALVDACTQALADETAHARLCFELASAYAGRGVGPGPLDVAGSLVGVSLDEVLELVIAEGCLGETRAVFDALEAAENATDPCLRDVYLLIARDEQRHAELAFRFVRWALQHDRETTRAALLEACRDLQASREPAALVAVPCFSALLELLEPPSTQEMTA